MKLLFCADEYSGVDDFVLKLQNVWRVFKPKSRFIVIDGRMKIRDFATDFYPERNYKTLKTILQLQNLLGEDNEYYVKEQIDEITLLDEDDILIVFNIFNSEILEYLKNNGFISVHLKTTEDKQIENLATYFPNYTPDEDLEKFMVRFEQLKDPLDVNEQTVLQLVQKLLIPTQ
jgi:hypothetical protein